MTQEEIYTKVSGTLIEALNVDEDQVTPNATLQGDLGAESIDFLDIVFRLEREFGIKIPREYGGLGLSQMTYIRAIELVTSQDGSLTALLSASQSIGVPQPLKLFGSEEQKRKFFPRLAKGACQAHYNRDGTANRRQHPSEASPIDLPRRASRA